MAGKCVCFYNGTAVLPDRILSEAVVVSRDGIITEIGTAAAIQIPADAIQIDARGELISPGFVDIHVHGGDGADFMDGTAGAVRTVNRAHARHGTTTIFPTTTTGSKAQISAMLRACKRVQQTGATEDGARIAGVHFYGPYFAEGKTGCHSKGGRRDPDPDEYMRDFDLDIVKIATCAAELHGAEAFYKEASRRGYLGTCGHSNASWPEMEAAYRAGMRHVDHFWCAMSSVQSLRARFGNPMRGSMEQFVLMHPEMSTEVIADGCHLAPELLEFAYRMKGPARMCLCTDANRALDMQPGKYRFGPASDGEWFDSDGRVGIQPNGSLASSVTGMDAMVRHMKNSTSATLAETIRMASLTPAERTGIENETGSLKVGKRSDILILGHDLILRRIFIGGEEFSPDVRSRAKRN